MSRPSSRPARHGLRGSLLFKNLALVNHTCQAGSIFTKVRRTKTSSTGDAMRAGDRLMRLEAKALLGKRAVTEVERVDSVGGQTRRASTLVVRECSRYPVNEAVFF